MDELKLISYKEFNAFIKCRGFKDRNDYMLKDLKAKFGFKPLKVRIALVVSLEDMEPTRFDFIREATSYVRNNGRDFVRRFKDMSIWEDSIKHGLLHWPTFWPDVGILVGIPLADTINIFIDSYRSVTKWLSHKVGTQEIGLQSQMLVVSRMLMFIGVFSNLILIL